ncbi:alpha/beta hydrolase [Brevibacillus agri]|uniref:alpha/beta hydrolase n=1 Tax=Brevibacillus agri TaxID=51101 RepID=UPI000472B62C|nr:alpha/beta hydrolase [Brevibacillus agri]MBG9564969.1 hypothetical protein [Brevibacillus agri]MBY0053506.1 alpha/beta hydrolase [Brevibacillus agri]
MEQNELFAKRIVMRPSDEKTSLVEVKKDVVYKTSDRGDLKMDVYYPKGSECSKGMPAVILIHGDGPWHFLQTIKDSGQYVSWGQLLAASGLIAVTFTHRSTERFSKLDEAVRDVEDALAYIRESGEQLGIARERLGIWVCSAGGPVGLPTALRNKAGDIRCVAALYAIMDLWSARAMLPDLDEQTLRAASARAALEEAPANLPPLLVAKAGADRADLNATIDDFVLTASKQNVSLDYYLHPDGRHAFDLWDDDLRSKQIINHTVAFFQNHLLEANSGS